MAKQKAQSMSGPYTAADYQALRLARRELSEVLGKMDRARACGVDCSQIAQVRQDIDDQLAQIELHFMTPPPG